MGIRKDNLNSLGGAEHHDSRELEIIFVLDIRQSLSHIVPLVNHVEIFTEREVALFGHVLQGVVSPWFFFSLKVSLASFTTYYYDVAKRFTVVAELALVYRAHLAHWVDHRRLIFVGVARQIVDEQDDSANQDRGEDVREQEPWLSQNHFEVLLDEDFGLLP